MALEWWVSSTIMTCLVVTDERQRIIGGAPIIRRFIGQGLPRLVAWLEYTTQAEVVARPLWGPTATKGTTDGE